MREGHKDLYWFGWNVPTSSLLLLLVLPALVCSRGYKRAREEEVPKSMMKRSMELGLAELVQPCALPLMGRPAFPFIDKGEGAGYRERERQARGKAREKKASRAAGSFFSFMRVPPTL